MKKLISILFMVVFSYGLCFGAGYMDYDEDLAPLGTDYILKSAGGEGSTRVSFNTLAGLHFQAYSSTLDTLAAITYSADVLSFLAAADYAAMRALLDLEAGTDFYSISAAGTAFLEATQLDDTKGNGDTAYIWSADKVFDQLALKLNVANPTFTGNLTVGLAEISETELEILDGATLNTTDINIIDGISDSGTLTAAELLYVDGVTSAIQTQLDARCLESVFGTALEADDLELSGTTLQLVAEIPHTDVAHTWTGTQTLPNEKYTILTSVPGAPVTGLMYCFDNDTADPCDVDGLDDYCARYDGADWVGMFKTNGTKFFSAVPVPTLLAGELNDTVGDRLLTDAELKGTIISNSGLTAAQIYNAPAMAEGWNFIIIKEADYNITLDPNGTENWYFRTDSSAYAANGAGTSIVNTTAGKSTLTCFSTESAVYCTGDANWAQGS